jgi:hypothetical protein
MAVKRILSVFVLGLMWPLISLAGTEDWQGAFLVKIDNKKIEKVLHLPNRVQFMFLSAGQCLHLAKGSNMNDVIIKENLNFCTQANVKSFIREVEKLGPIVEQYVKVGPSYSN